MRPLAGAAAVYHCISRVVGGQMLLDDLGKEKLEMIAQRGQNAPTRSVVGFQSFSRSTEPKSLRGMGRTIDRAPGCLAPFGRANLLARNKLILGMK